MSETQIDYGLLATFVAVATEKSFTRAAKRRGMTKGTVSRSITRLEEQLGLELVHRTTHQVALSTAGAALLERVAPHLLAMQEAVQGLPEGASEPSGTLRITLPQDLGALVMGEVIAHFCRRYPKVNVELSVEDRVVDLVEGGFDAALRVTPKLKDSSLIARSIARATLGCYAAPSYLARRGKPKAMGAAGHDWIMSKRFSEIANWSTESLVRIWADDFLFSLEAAKHGGGVTLLPRFVAARSVRDGSIEEVNVPHGFPEQGTLRLVYPSSGQVPRKLTAFRDFLVDWFKKSPLG